MSITIILLVVILLLLAVIIVMMVTGWPGRERAEIERTGSELRREMAEQRAESIRLMQTIRNEVEDAIQESFNHQLSAYVSAGRPPRFSRHHPPAAEHGSEEETAGEAGKTIPSTPDPEKLKEQMSLFQEQVKPDLSVLPNGSEEAGKEPEETEAGETGDESMERVEAVLHDDIPDIEDIQDFEDEDIR